MYSKKFFDELEEFSVKKLVNPDELELEEFDEDDLPDLNGPLKLE